MDNCKSKIIVILGPTASGKSEVAIRLAKKFGGEIISADSRQIYRGMDIATGKVHGTWNKKHGTFISEGIAHHMIDIVSPKTEYNVAKFKKDAEKIIENILKRRKLPIICGGTGFWIKAVVDNISFPEVKPDWKLRERLERLGTEKLFIMLEKLDPERAKNIDKHNKVRLIRAIEICKAIGKVPEISSQSTVHSSPYDFLQIGIDVPKEKLHRNIKKRLQKRFSAGMIEEVKNLRKKYKLSWEKIQSFGLVYYWIPLYLQNKIGRKELFEKIYSAEKDYAKRQITWFRKDKQIIWLENYQQIQKEIIDFTKRNGS